MAGSLSRRGFRWALLPENITDLPHLSPRRHAENEHFNTTYLFLRFVLVIVLKYSGISRTQSAERAIPERHLCFCHLPTIVPWTPNSSHHNILESNCDLKLR
jgi:hypothetical protein